MKPQSRFLILFSVVLYLLLIAALVYKVKVATGGPFVYALDDPYIHLALAENLAHGHYGINPQEFSSPSSSIVWPLLLIPFAGSPFHLYLPLAWNILFGVLAAGLLGRVVSEWPYAVGQPRPALWQRAATVALLLFAANLPSLTLTGMEHVLQVLLAVSCALGISRALSGLPIPPWCLLTAAVAPAIRYEDLALTLAVSLALWGVRRQRAALTVFAASLVPLFAFSLFLHSKGLPLLPMSVLVKGGAYAGNSLPYRFFDLVHTSLQQSYRTIVRYPILVLTLTFIAFAWRARTVERRFIFSGAAALGALQLTIGRFGWFHRYEIYAVIFLLLLLLRVTAELPSAPFPLLAMALMFCAASSIEAAADTATASRAIWEQHYQIHRFVTDFYKGDYAVNDLGLASFRRRPGAYVLDVYGLASPEAARQSVKSAAWLAGITERHGTDLAILYPDWYDIPEVWTPLARLCVDDQGSGNIGGKCAVFYSTRPATEAVLRDELKQFSKVVPQQVGFYLAKPEIKGSLWHLVTHPVTPSLAP